MPVEVDPRSQFAHLLIKLQSGRETISGMSPTSTDRPPSPLTIPDATKRGGNSAEGGGMGIEESSLCAEDDMISGV
jgi:hypothetical protein